MAGHFVRYFLFIAMLATLPSLAGCERTIDSKIGKRPEKTDYGIFNDGKIHVILLGTGTPRPNVNRGRPATAVIAGGHFLLFDAGDGTVDRVHKEGLPLDKLENVFITHWHSDHFGGVGEVINQTWIFNRQNPIHVYGPEGIDQVLGPLSEAYELDHSYRSAVGDGVSPEVLAVAQTHAVAPRSDEELAVVWEQDGLRVSAFYVEHQPVEPALGYKIEYRGRTILISGDTRVTRQMAEHGWGADIWVHEALNSLLFDRGLKAMRDAGRDGQADRAENVKAYHASTLELADLAQEAGVKMLVLTHLVPAPTGRIAEDLFIEGMRNLYHGELIVGRDGMDIELKPAH